MFKFLTKSFAVQVTNKRYEKIRDQTYVRKSIL